MTVNIRVHDRVHRRGSQPYSDRFNLNTNLEPGREVIRISMDTIRRAPDSREMNMTEIDGLVVFVTRSEAGRSLVLHSIRLE